jgi:S-methylmethionine-dependent homocysteine/selenocysteine methylase
MHQHPDRLPQLGSRLFLTDGGIETTLIFHDGLDLPHFAAFHLLRDEAGRSALRRYFMSYLEIARANGAGFILESPTWRASADWGAKLGYSAAAMADVNRRSIDLMRALYAQYAGPRMPIVISGCVGPRGDGYNPASLMSAAEAEAYHAQQIAAFEDAQVDMVTAITMTYPAEAIGIARAARAAGLPVALSFTVETDGRLPTGETLCEAIETVDDATDGTPAYYMLNCAHPTHFDNVLAADQPWARRLRGLRANASMRSHAELDQATELDDGNPVELGEQYRALRARMPWLTILGGCCGTDHRHIEAAAHACRPAA